MSATRERLPAAALALLCAAGILPVLRSLIVPDLNWCYRYVSSDSYDWIANGLHLAGAPVASSFRPPGFALAIATLWKLGALEWLPALNFAALGASVALLWALLRERHGPPVVAIACWFFFANEAVQDMARYVLAETLGTPFLLLAALAFVRAGRDARWYLVLGAALGLGFLVSYVAAPAAAGFAGAVLLRHREDLRRRPLWAGAGTAALIAGTWIAIRAAHDAANPYAARHGVEAILRPSLSNVGFYVFSATAVMGLLPLPLYAWGFARLLRRPPAEGGRYRTAVFATLGSVGFFWLFLYDWADRRFLVYLAPFLACLLAEGLEGLAALARRGAPWRRAAAAAFVLAALLWNQIRYPSYGFFHLALTPVHFLVMGLTFTPAAKAVLHAEGAKVERIHRNLPGAFARGLFDVRQRPPDCPAADRACVARLKQALDGLLASGEPVGFIAPRSWGDDFYGSKNRLGNALLRPVEAPGRARMTFAAVDALPPGTDPARPPEEASCGPYVVRDARASRIGRP